MFACGSELRRLFMVLACVGTMQAVADDLEVKTAEAIRTACHGNMLDKDSGILSEYIYKNSPLCKEINTLPEGVDYEPVLQRHNIRLSQSDLDRIFDKDYLKRAPPSQIEQECTVRRMGERSGVDSLCQQVRELLVDSKRPMSQQQFEAVSLDCDGHRECVQLAAAQWRDGKAPRQQLRDVGGVSIDDLMGDSARTPRSPDSSNTHRVWVEPDEDDSQQRIASFMANEPEGNNTQPARGQISFDNIYEERNKIVVQGLKQTLLNQSNAVSGKCLCSFQGGSCFKGKSFQYAQLNQALKQVGAQFESQKHQVCSKWRANIFGKTSQDEALLNQYIGINKATLSNLNKLDSGFAEANAKFENKQREVRLAEQRRQQQLDQQQRQKSGFNWGKFTGLATGTLIGAGMGDLGGADTLQLLGKISLDSMEGVQGVENLNQGVTDISNTYSDHYDQMANIQAQADQMNMDVAAPQQAANNQYESLLKNTAPPQAKPESKDDGTCSPSGITGYPQENIYWDGAKLFCSDNSSPVHGSGYWAGMECPSATQRLEVKACRGEVYQNAKRASCAYSSGASKVQCDCETSATGNNDVFYCMKKAQDYLKGINN